MRKFIMVIGILLATFLIGQIIVKAAGWDHIIGSGLNGSSAVALKVDADGILYIRD